ncbi:uncharacterized protein LY89DRAFT_680054 [Mollisia scopiformis]|uniref:Uncharacterized protein n=1 Tax=Mollisia scopiformis TaxID=149040 RepID=A0A194XU93_MOLSC|nr:uncharacterized protein LY89DRAFT_680054 [Mollisia scopiformis]KUJ23277.1 hypothetical protein LY89DRAFT_680054 [Mollisia scopiformis]
MCTNTKITYLLCLHNISQFRSCRPIITFLLRRGRCETNSTEAFINDYCERCRHFWDRYSISEESRRARAADFRLESDYHGPITPSAVPSAGGKAWFFGFVKDEEEKPARDVSELKLRRKVDVGEASISDMTENKGKRRDSMDSGGTVWPSGIGEKDGDDESKRLGPDEYGNDSDVASDWSRGEGVIKPEEFDLQHLERQLCGSMEEEQGAEKRDQRLRPAAPMPGITLQRRTSMIHHYPAVVTIPPMRLLSLSVNIC